MDGFGQAMGDLFRFMGIVILVLALVCFGSAWQMGFCFMSFLAVPAGLVAMILGGLLYVGGRN
mgnify:CR=1 FL=1